MDIEGRRHSLRGGMPGLNGCEPGRAHQFVRLISTIFAFFLNIWPCSLAFAHCYFAAICKEWVHAFFQWTHADVVLHQGAVPEFRLDYSVPLPSCRGCNPVKYAQRISQAVVGA